MPTPRLTLFQEFRASYRAGPRAWRCVALFLFAFCLCPMVSWWVLALFALFTLPAYVGAGLGRFVGSVREERMIRRLHRRSESDIAHA